ncbi:MAG: MFS transporter [Deltaproteobacteria bacterium]|nr:MAG: MFS transporter [Deltaproteobacteria bacterium]
MPERTAKSTTSIASSSAKPRVPMPFFIVAAANFLFFLNFAFFFLLPIWVLRHGGGEEIAGRVVGVSGFAGLCVLPLIGYLLDRFGRRRFMIGGAVAASITSFAFMTLDGVGPLLYLLRVIQGIAFTCAFTSAQTLAVLFAPIQRRAEAIGWFGVSTILTHAISPALGEEIVRRWGFNAMFATGGVLALLALAMACVLPQPPELESDGQGRRIDPAMARRAVGTAALAMVCYGFGFGATQTFVPVLMERFAIGRIGVFFAAWSFTAVTVRIVLGSASDRYGRHAVLVPAMLTMSAAVAMLVFVRSMPGILAVGLTFGLAQGLLYPTMNALVADWSSAHNIGRTQSLFSGSYSLGIASCSFFFGSIAERFGYAAMFSTTLAITLVGLAVFLTGPRRVTWVQID